MARSNDPAFIIKLLEETENEVLGGDSSDDESDCLVESDHNSETEQSANSDFEENNFNETEHSASTSHFNVSEPPPNLNYDEQCRLELNLDEYTSDEDDLPYSERVTCFYGKPKKNKSGKIVEHPLKWYRKPPPQNVRTAARNIIIHLPGVKGLAKNASTPFEAWNQLFDNDMLFHIVACTNKYIDKKKDKFSRERDAQQTSFEEIKAFIGVLYICGIMKSSHLNTKDIWEKDGTGIDVVMCTMSRSRFHFLMQAIRFDDITTRATRRQVDKITHVRYIFERFVSNSQNAYTISEYATIDEKLEGFRGRCSFRQYIRNKPSKYGIKIFMLSDSRTYYTNNMEIYAGTQPDGVYQVSNSAQDVVKRMVQPITGTNRNITIDNWFTSIPLALDLLKTHKLTLVGTLRRDKREVPSDFVTTKHKEVFSSRFGFHPEKMTLVSYVPNKKKVVLCLSTMHYDNKIDESTGEQKKPELITFYNATKGGVDVVDRMCSNYSVSRTSNRWPLTIFYCLLDIAGINSQVIYNSNTNDMMSRRTFLKALGKELIQTHLRTRLEIVTLPKELRSRIAFVLGQPRHQPQQHFRKNARYV